MSKNFAKDLDEYISLITMRLVDISIDIQNLSLILGDLCKELTEISNTLKVKNDN